MSGASAQMKPVGGAGTNYQLRLWWASPRSSFEFPGLYLTLKLKSYSWQWRIVPLPKVGRPRDG